MFALHLEAAALLAELIHLRELRPVVIHFDPQPHLPMARHANHSPGLQQLWLLLH
jgi:hypothetical protein